MKEEPQGHANDIPVKSEEEQAYQLTLLERE
jgi:hypothetical protein